MTTPPDTPKPPAEQWLGVNEFGLIVCGYSNEETAIMDARRSGLTTHRYILAPSPQESHKLAEELEKVLAEYDAAPEGSTRLDETWRIGAFVAVRRKAVLAALRSSPSEQEKRVAQRNLIPIRKAAANILYETGCLANMIEAAIAASGGAKT